MTQAYEFTNKDIFNNILLLTDGYKPSHWRQYPKGTQVVYSYLESRGSIKDENGNDVYDETVFFGLKYFIDRYLTGQVVTVERIREAKEFFDAYIGPGLFNEEGWMHILRKYEGRLPVVIKAVPEGTVVPLGNVLVTIENTGGEETAWLTNYLETLIVQVWYPTTVATNSREIKKIVKEYFDKTSDAPIDSIDFSVHDFGFRGVSSVETAGLGAAAHLTSFKGTDTIAGITVLQKIYKATEMPAFSIPASEHSTMTSWGRENEVDAMENMLDQFPTGLVACVSDSYDIRDAILGKWGTALREKILSRDGTLVIRPDSGDPVYTTQFIVESLWEKFGGAVNSKGYKVLDSHVRIIQGDGVDMNMIRKILVNFERLGFSAENIAFGSGGGLLQKFDRDTMKFAFKCSYIDINGEDRDVRKFPMEFDSNGNYNQSFKVSKSGKLGLIKTDDGFKTVSAEEAGSNDVLKTVFSGGYSGYGDNRIETIRHRASL